MPNALTHKYISDTILASLDANTREVVSTHLDEYHLGCLGPDMIMGLLLDKDEVKKMAGEKLHDERIFESLFSMAEYFKNDDNRDGALFSYYIGFLTHYAADSVIHPYVYDYIDHRMRQKFDPILNNCLHTIIETEMDVYIDHYCLDGKNADTFHQFNWCRKKRRTVKKYFLQTNKDVFRLTLTERDVDTSIFWFSLVMRVCQRHKNGYLRYLFCERIDRMLKAEHLLISALRPRELDDRYDYLNLNKDKYMSIYNCLDKCAVYKYSFPEQLELARLKGVRLINLAMEHIAGGQPLVIDDFYLTYNGSLNNEYKSARGLIIMPTVDLPKEEFNLEIY